MSKMYSVRFIAPLAGLLLVLWAATITRANTWLPPVQPAAAPAAHRMMGDVVGDADRLVAGTYHACHLTGAGGVRCWGGNRSGQLGDGSTTHRSTTAFVRDLFSGVVAIAAGGEHTCALTSVGGVQCWGNNTLGQLGDGTTGNRHRPVDVVGLSRGVKAISAGGGRTCALLATGALLCWGFNSYGQVGDGGTTNRLTPTAVTGLSSGVTAVFTGFRHTCALVGEAVKCWGWNADGQLGDGSTTTRLTPIDVTGLNGVTTLALGTYHSCALLTNGGVKCWGGNGAGQVGNGSEENQPAPVNVTGLSSGVVALASAAGHSCAILTSGGVNCWGDNFYGQLGNGNQENQREPVTVTGVSDADYIALGANHSCSFLNRPFHRRLQCWGHGGMGQLGNGILLSVLPHTVRNLGNATALATGRHHGCAISLGHVWCWGRNANGQLGNGTTQAQLQAEVITGLADGRMKTVAAGAHHSCAAGTGRTPVWCWGLNSSGQLGNGARDTTLTPVTVAELTVEINLISAQHFHTCVLTGGASAGLACWGANQGGEIGDHNKPHDRLTPYHVPDFQPDPLTSVVTGDIHTCVLAGAKVYCWGANASGQLGNGSNAEILDPAAGLVAGLAEVSNVGVGPFHTCVVSKATGAVQCWGSNGAGQLGNGETVDRNTPVTVTDLTNVVQVAGGREHTCALLAGGNVKCWGANLYGELGNGLLEQSLAPVDVQGITNAISLSTGRENSCALLADGHVRCWGSNRYGQLGNGFTDTALSAVDVSPLPTEGIHADTSSVITSENASLLFPSAIFSEPVAISYSPLSLEQVAAPPGGSIAIDRAFDLSAAYQSTGQPAQPQAGQSYSMTISYAGVNLGLIDPATLAIYFWDGTAWVKEAGSQVNTQAQTVTATPNHFSIRAIFGEPNANGPRLYLPTVRR